MRLESAAFNEQKFWRTAETIGVFFGELVVVDWWPHFNDKSRQVLETRSCHVFTHQRRILPNPAFLGKDWESKVISDIDDGQSTQSYDQIFRSEALSLEFVWWKSTMDRWKIVAFGTKGTDLLNLIDCSSMMETWIIWILNPGFGNDGFADHCWSILWHTQERPDLLAGPSKPPAPEAVDQKSDKNCHISIHFPTGWCFRNLWWRS